MKHFNLIGPRRRIETTTFGDKCRVFIEPDGSTSFELFDPLDPGVEWEVNHPQQAEEYCQQHTTWWTRLVAAVRSAW